MMNWAYNLDMLAQNGVIDFDAPSYIMGQAPRYVGNPANPNPFNAPVPKVPNFDQPQIDEFKIDKKEQENQSEKAQVKPDKENKAPLWKKLAFGAIVTGLLIFGGYKIKSVRQWFSKQFTKLKGLTFQDVKDFVVNKAKATGNFFKNGWTKFINFFKSKPKTTP